MPEPILHKYLDIGDRAVAHLTLPSGERMLLSIGPSGFGLYRLYLRGLFPGRCLFGQVTGEMTRMARVIARSATELPALPTAAKHRDESAAEQPPLSLFTRLALTALDAQDLARRYERVRNTAG
jgi:hypothetical protein